MDCLCQTEFRALRASTAELCRYAVQSAPTRHRTYLKESVDIIVPRGMQNRVAINVIVRHIQKTLAEKSKMHRNDLQRLGQEVEKEPISSNIVLMQRTSQLVGITTILQDPATDDVDFNFYLNRIATLLVER